MYAQQSHPKVRTVVIDAGHGGKDPGALGKSHQEKSFCLSIALKLGNYIQENIPGVKVIYTRTTDVFLELDKRTDIANKACADVFISIHINSCADRRLKGASTYVTGLTRSEENLQLALLENSSYKLEDDYKIKYAGFESMFDPENYIISNLYQGINLNQSLLLAGKVQDQFDKRAGRKNLGVKQAAFAVLWRATMPSILVECGFISNADEEAYMATDEGQAVLASAIYRAFKQYKIETESGKYTTPKTQPVEDVNIATPDENKTPSTVSSNSDDAATNSNTSKNNIFFTVQIKSVASKLPSGSSEFKGLSNVTEYKIDGMYKYTVGKETNFEKIVEIQKTVRTKIPDAFVIAIQNGKRVDIKTAKQILNAN